MRVTDGRLLSLSERDLLLRVHAASNRTPEDRGLPMAQLSVEDHIHLRRLISLGHVAGYADEKGTWFFKPVVDGSPAPSQAGANAYPFGRA